MGSGITIHKKSKSANPTHAYAIRSNYNARKNIILQSSLKSFSFDAFEY